MVAIPAIPALWKAKAEEPQIQAQPGKLRDTCLRTKKERRTRDAAQ